MAWPPPVLPINRTDATPQQTTHAADHNAANQAINDIVTKVGGYSFARGFVQGAPGSYPPGTDFCSFTIAAAGVDRTLTFAYNALVTNNTGGLGFMEAFANGGQISVAQLAAGAGAQSSVQINVVGFPLVAGAPYTFLVRNTIVAVTLQSAAATNHLWYQVHPA